MNGVALANLPQLVLVDLRDNVCINQLFEIEGGSNTFRRKVSKKCASGDDVKKQLSCMTSTACSELQDLWHTKADCCELEYETLIDTPDYTFAGHINYTTVEILIIKHQQNVEFLPVLAHERFSVLKVYFISNAPVQKISKKNFEKLFNLAYLMLDRNQIEIIKSDTFEDLLRLERIWISMTFRIIF